MGVLLSALGVLRRLWTVVWGVLKLTLALPIGVFLAAALAGFLLGAAHGNARYHAGYAKGSAVVQAKWDKAAKAATRRNGDLGTTGARVTAGVHAQLSRQAADTHDDFTSLRRKVSTHVSAKSDAGCVVPLGFVRLLNDGIDGPGRRPPALPGAAGRPEDANSGLALSDLADQLLGGFEIPYGWRAENVAWRDWYGGQCAAWVAKGGQCAVTAP